MNWLLIIGVILNLFLVISEIIILKKVKKKSDILKYYTFLQNFLTLVTSLILIVNILLNWCLNVKMYEIVSGLRYISVCGLVFTTFIYSLLLAHNDQSIIREDDLMNGFNPKVANVMLHYICPGVSTISFLVCERSLILENGVWTSIAAVPSILYGMLSFCLVSFKVWDVPYDFSLKAGKQNSKLIDGLIVLLMPISFIFISYILWNVR